MPDYSFRSGVEVDKQDLAGLLSLFPEKFGWLIFLVVLRLIIPPCLNFFPIWLRVAVVMVTAMLPYRQKVKFCQTRV